jgi:2-polyprenyl-6-methoxyphenol hydroxylase-like FAD-dependent oxidoreductase
MPHNGGGIDTEVCIAGGGPAGVMLGYLLARAGIRTAILEKHKDFLRDFRGDTVHPSTMQVLHELGLLEEFLKRPHQRIDQITGQVNGERLHMADFRRLDVAAPFIAMMPQWDFLDFLAGHGRMFPGFDLRMETEAADLIVEDGIVRGVIANGRPIRAKLTIGADGRHSTVREKAGLEVIDTGAPIDVLWMRLPRYPGDPEDSFGYIAHGHVFVTIPRGDYWQCAFVIVKGEYDKFKARGIDGLRREIVSIAPFMQDRIEELRDWEQVKLLTVSVDHLRAWFRPGLLCIGDAAHAMSPVGGVGINLAIQDAVAAANILAPALRDGTLTDATLRAVQKRRELPMRLTQTMQNFIHKTAFRPVTEHREARGIPPMLKLLNYFPALRRIPARLIGIGFRPEHIA